MSSASYCKGFPLGYIRELLPIGERVGIGVSEDGFSFKQHAKGIVSIDPESEWAVKNYSRFGDRPRALFVEGASSDINGTRPTPLPYARPAIDIELYNLSSYDPVGNPIREWKDMNIVFGLGEGGKGFFPGMVFAINKTPATTPDGMEDSEVFPVVEDNSVVPPIFRPETPRNK